MSRTKVLVAGGVGALLALTLWIAATVVLPLAVDRLASSGGGGIVGVSVDSVSLLVVSAAGAAAGYAWQARRGRVAPAGR